MDHALAEQLLERHSPFMHQRKDNVAHVTVSVNRPRPPFGERACERSVSLMRFDDAPLPGL